MTDEQKKARKKSAESGHIKWLKDNCLRTKYGKDDYVFISYKSDDFEEVLDNIVYNTCKKYGLRVYFDTAFDEGSDLWVKQYYDNMKDTKCKAFIAFLDNAYYSSYACLLEMMSRKTAAAGGDYVANTLFFLPINIGEISYVTDGSNTGLGTKRFSNGRINNHALEELKRFNKIFNQVADDETKMELYDKSNDKIDESSLYYEETDNDSERGEMYLSVTQCRRIMDRIIGKDGQNENDGSNKEFVEVIHDKLIKAGIKSVFGTIPPTPTTSLTPPTPTPPTPPTPPKPTTTTTVDAYYIYKIFGKEYYANEREQGKLMYDAFSALTEKYPEKAEELTKKTSVARVEDVTDENTKYAKPVYFRACRQFTVGGHNYYVGTSYSFEAKLNEIKDMFKICGADPNEFVLIKAGEKIFSPDDSDVVNPETDEGYVYTIFGKEYYANEREQGKLMYDAFSVLTEKYPEKVEQLTRKTSIARAEDVTDANTKYAKPVYFKTCRQFTVGGHNYYVGASYGFDAKLSEIKGMFKICGADPNEFVIISQPERTVRTRKSEKAGIDELLQKGDIPD